MQALAEELRSFALGFPESYEDFPWGERVVKVNKRVFVFLFSDDERVHVTVKLPESREIALIHPFADPTAYGLGKSGWVTLKLTPDEEPPLESLKAWIDESYRAIAPKRLVKLLNTNG